MGQRRPRGGWQWAPGASGPCIAYIHSPHKNPPPNILCNTPTVAFFFFNTHPGVLIPIFAPKISPPKLYLISFDPVRLCGYSWKCPPSISTSRTSRDNALVAGRYYLMFQRARKALLCGSASATVGASRSGYSTLLSQRVSRYHADACELICCVAKLWM